MRRRVLKKVGLILFVILIVLIILVLWWVLHSTGKIKEYRDVSGKIIENSVSEKFTMKINGYENGFFITGKNKENPVLLFVSSGPGTDDFFLNESYPDMHLDDLYTICYWDYRGMGIAYDSGIDPNQISMEALVEDGYAVTCYLKERFHQDKIYLCGFSGGAKISLHLAAAYPQEFFALINMAQPVTNGVENDTLMYQFMKDVFAKRNDAKNLRKLEQSVETVSEGQVRCKDWYSYVMLLHEAGGGTIMDKSEFQGITLPILTCQCYTAKEKIEYILGMKMYRSTPVYDGDRVFDYRKEIPWLSIPVYFISGDHDYNAPWPLVSEYANLLEAPVSKFYLIKDCAHSPMWEQQEAVYQVMDEILKEGSW